MLLRWFDAGESKRFGADLATFFATVLALALGRRRRS